MLKFLKNTGDYFSSNYFDEDFTSKVLSKTGYTSEDIKEFNKEIENKLGKDMHYLKRNVPKNHYGYNSADDPRFLKLM